MGVDSAYCTVVGFFLNTKAVELRLKEEAGAWVSEVGVNEVLLGLRGIRSYPGAVRPT